MKNRKARTCGEQEIEEEMSEKIYRIAIGLSRACEGIELGRFSKGIV